MVNTTRYVHTNIIARDWEQLARFYEEVLECRRIPPGRDLSGRWLEDGTGIPGAHLTGIHLRLPGHGENGPTLEIFQYDNGIRSGKKGINEDGFVHLAFHVDDVAAALAGVLSHGGSQVGKLVKTDVAGVGHLTFAYARDPEGNIIELQNWKR